MSTVGTRLVRSAVRPWQVALILQVISCTDSRYEVAHDQRIAVLTADGYFSVIRAADGSVTQRIRVAEDVSGVGPGNYLAHERGTQRVFVILPRTIHRNAEVAKITIGTKRVERHSLRDARVDFRSIALGVRSRAVLVAGDGPDGLALTRLNIDSLGEQTVATINARSDFDWRVYDVALDAAEETVYVSYHGTRTTGIDAFDAARLRLHACERVVPNHGCLAAHGNVISSSIGLIAATGGQYVYVYRDSARNAADLGLDAHVMEIGFDSTAKRIIGIGSCHAGGGIGIYEMNANNTVAVVDSVIAFGVRVLAPCGEKLALLPGENAIVVSHGEGLLSKFDLRTRKVFDTARVSGRVLDMLVIDRIVP